MVSAGLENMWLGGGGADVEAARWRREKRARGRYMVALVGLILWGDEEQNFQPQGKMETRYIVEVARLSCSTMDDDGLVILVGRGQIVRR